MELKFMTETTNPIGLDGIDFVEYASPKPEALHQLFQDFGFSKLAKHKTKSLDYYKQNDIHFFVNREPNSFAGKFTKLHGPSISSMGWRVQNAKKAFESAVARGAKPAKEVDFFDKAGNPIPAIYGIGDSLIYFIDTYSNPNRYQDMGFDFSIKQETVPDKGFMFIDHLTNNVEKGTMDKWAEFYKGIFGFTQIRYFDIRGVKTGLTSFALRSPCGKFCIPINEADEFKSQINEYLREYNGPGIQHIAFATTDILTSLEKLKKTSVQTLEIDDEYYASVFDRVPNVTEDKKRIRDLNVLVDGDDEGYLLQIFTKNVVGPIFIEIIQRKNHFNFGEGNFGALFRSIEKDQAKRGVFDDEKKH